MFEQAELGIECPKCGHENKKTVAWIKAHNSLTCAGCNETIRLDKRESLSMLSSKLTKASRTSEK
jgi:hypothetical protein